MESSTFFPNQCIICQSTTKLSRCTSCNMIQYCNKNHQVQHWPQHKAFCKAIAKMLETKKITHIYEKISNKSFDSWASAAGPIIQEVVRNLKRLPISIESVILKYPRVCFVCREAKQEKLKNCPNCPLASFCDQHPNSEIHERHCYIIKNNSEIILRKVHTNPYLLKNQMKALAKGTKILKPNDESPTSIRQFYDNYTKPNCEISEIQKIFLSEFFSISLTMFHNLQMIYFDNFPPEIVIHLDIGGAMTLITIDDYWEILLHLIPDVKILKIIHIEGEINHMSEPSLCKDCKLKKKKLFIEANSMPYERYLTQSSYQKPSLIAYLNINPPGYENIVARNDWLKTIEGFRKVTSPMLFAPINVEKFTIVEKDFLNSSIKFNIIYSGFNHFSSLMHNGIYGDGSVSRNYQFLILLQQNDVKNNFESLNAKINRPRSCFYSQICHVCRKLEAKIICNRCRIISYCNNKHRDQDQIHHKDICRVILMLMKEMNTANLFDNAKTSDSELWLRAKIDIMKKVKTQLGRKLEEYEKQMFLFPKACAICHDSDSSLLKNCECGVSLCKIHNKDPNHKKLCKELSIAYKMSTTETEPNLNFMIRINVVKGSIDEYPSSMLEFINSFSEPTITNYQNHEEINYQHLATSNFITDMLTLRYYIKKINPLFTTITTMVIHIIVVNKNELMSENSWKQFLYSFQQLKNLEIVFIGPEVPNCPERIFNTPELNTIEKRRLKIDYCSTTYDKYFRNKKFIKPQIILGCNLNIHESKLFEILENTWKETILTVEKVGVPFILTSGTKERAEMEHKIICDLLGKSVNFQFFEENPYSSLTPERDFETEGVMYANKFVIAYDGKYQNSSNSTNENKIKINENSQLATNITITEENNSKAKEIINKTKEIKVCENLSNENKNENPDLLLLQQRNKFLIDENEKLKEQLISANTQIAEQKNQILNLNNQILQLEKTYIDFVKKFQENINLTFDGKAGFG
ncbi:uncharacterized protein LOC127281245 [Leptopilina boulardi]|uniref:uncharacterized protein LOC127281245 n=1 Tax=Leptopilina boulardi TaxID=63433 RepID=UPI0021F5AD19|nr:uncharacterized protein LOC127281245 [Leptopilina boulardi]